MRFKEKGNGLLLSTHVSRIDWLLAVYVGMVGRAQARVGFVAEVTTALMPILGWSRYLLGDILLQRAFHKDRPRILDNISAFHKSKVDRVLFLAPEGTIADPDVDDEYVKNCFDFMRKEKREPLTHLLTPRYKGMSAFVTHAPDNIASCSMCFVKDHPTVNPATGAVEGGVNTTKPLLSPGRQICDLHDIFGGGLKVFVKIQPLELFSDRSLLDAGREFDDAGAKKIREQLIEDQVLKDSWTRTFDETGKYPGIETADDWDVFPTLHFRMNGILAVHTYLTMVCGALIFGCSQATFLRWMVNLVLGTFVTHGASYTVGILTTDGKSRESLVGETAIKAFLRVAFGRNPNQGGKKEIDEAKGRVESKKTK